MQTDHSNRPVKATYYRIEWLIGNNEVRYNRAELYETHSAAVAAAETIKGELGAQYAPLLRRWMVDAEYRIVTVQVLA